MRGVRERRQEAAHALVLTAGARFEHVEPSFDAVTDPRVVADDEMQKGDLYARSPVAAKEAPPLGEVERAREHVSGPNVARNHPRETIAAAFDHALEEARLQIKAPPGPMVLDGGLVELVHRTRQLDRVLVRRERLDHDARLLHAAKLSFDLVSLLRREARQVVVETSGVTTRPVELKSIASQVTAFLPLSGFGFPWKKDVNPRSVDLRAQPTSRLGDAARGKRSVFTGSHQNPRAGSGGEGDGHNQLRIIANSKFVGELRPAPVEHELAFAVRLEVRWGGGHEFGAAPERQVRRQPARFSAHATGLFERIEPRVFDEGRCIGVEQRVPSAARHFVHTLEHPQRVRRGAHRLRGPGSSGPSQSRGKSRWDSIRLTGSKGEVSLNMACRWREQMLGRALLPMHVAVVQLNTQDDLTQSLESVRHWIAQAAAEGAQLVTLPENFAFMGEEARKRELAERLDGAFPGPILSTLAESAAKHGVWVLGGGMPEKSDDLARPYNTSVLVDSRGGVAATYRKVHLFDVTLPDGNSHRESAVYSPGSEVVTAEVLGVGVGLSICYDLRFPELYRRLVTQGVRVVSVPAAFTQFTGKDHWHALLRARAIENQVYVLAPAQQGRHPRGRQTYGKSLIVDPWGDVLAQCSDGEGIATARLDFGYQDRVRTALPALLHRIW